MSNKIKIAFISTPNLPIPAINGGAIETLVTALVDQNEKKKCFDITIYTYENKDLSKVSGLYTYTNIVQVPKSNKIQMFVYTAYKVVRKLFQYSIGPRNHFMNQVNKLLDKEYYDAIIFESTFNEVIQFDNKNNTKVLFHVHADMLKSTTPQIQKVYNNCDALVGVSNFICSRLEKLNISKTKIYSLHNAVDITKITESYSIEKRDALRSKLGYGTNDKVVVYCSRISPEKGVLELVKAIQKIKDCKLLIIGGADFSSNEQTPYVKDVYNEARKIKDRVVFTGYIPHNDVYKYMAAADIAVVPSVCNEAASLTLLEFRALGLCTVASHRGGIPEYCTSESTILVETDKNFIANLANAISQIIRNKNVQKKMSSHSSDNLEYFSYEKYYDRFLSLILNVI